MPLKNGKHVAHSTQLLIISPSVTWNKLPVHGKVLTDEMTPVIDHYGGNEEYRTLAISHYTREFKKGEERQGESRKGPALSFKFSAQGMSRRLQNIYYDILQPQNWHSQKSDTESVPRFVKWQHKLNANFAMPHMSWNISQKKVEAWLKIFWWNSDESGHSTSLKPTENSSLYKINSNSFGISSKEMTALLLYLLDSISVRKPRLL